jgi:hypothetical protein
MTVRRPSRSQGPNQLRRVADRRALLVAGAFLFEVVAGWLRSGRLGGNVFVRCRRGHVFTTIWIPGASIKSLRLGWWRVQYCPVGRHWSVVTPFRESTLSGKERRAAREHHDIRLP